MLRVMPKSRALEVARKGHIDIELVISEFISLRTAIATSRRLYARHQFRAMEALHCRGLDRLFRKNNN